MILLHWKQYLFIFISGTLPDMHSAVKILQGLDKNAGKGCYFKSS
jgi:hypothetical protein